MKNSLVLASALALASLSTTALAAEGNRGYVRAEIGNSDVDLELDGVGSVSTDDTSFSLRTGYYFNPNFAIEGSYSHLLDENDGGASLELSGFGVGIVGKANFGADGNGFFISGRAGVEQLKGKVSDGTGSLSDTSAKPYYGAGIGYDFSENLGLGLNYDFHQADFDDISVDANTVSLGGEYRF